MTSLAVRTLVVDFSTAARLSHNATLPVGFTALPRLPEGILWAHVPHDAAGPIRLFGANTSPSEYALKYPGESFMIFENGDPTIPFYYASTDGTTVTMNIMRAQ